MLILLSELLKWSLSGIPLRACWCSIIPDAQFISPVYFLGGPQPVLNVSSYLGIFIINVAAKVKA